MVGELNVSSSAKATILTENDDVPGSKFESEPTNYTVEQLKRWLKCRGIACTCERLSQQRTPSHSRSWYRQWEMAGSENFAK